MFSHLLSISIITIKKVLSCSTNPDSKPKQSFFNLSDWNGVYRYLNVWTFAVHIDHHHKQGFILVYQPRLQQIPFLFQSGEQWKTLGLCCQCWLEGTDTEQHVGNNNNAVGLSILKFPHFNRCLNVAAQHANCKATSWHFEICTVFICACILNMVYKLQQVCHEIMSLYFVWILRTWIWSWGMMLQCLSTWFAIVSHDCRI